MALKLQTNLSFSKHVFSPSNIYCLSHGLTFELESASVITRGGLSSSVVFPSLEESQDYRAIEEQTGAMVIGIENNSLSEMAFRMDDGVISASSLSEELLYRLNALEAQIKRIIQGRSSIDDNGIALGREWCAYLDDLIHDNTLGPDQLKLKITDLVQQGIPITEAFFLFNAIQIAEDMRHVVLSACHSFANMTSQVSELNQHSKGLYLWGLGPGRPGEIFLMSEEVDSISFAYRNAVISCYSALDMLYELFVYLTKEPFGDPSFPKNLHFPDGNRRSTFQKGSEPTPNDPPETLYLASIPNLKNDFFGALRHTRNDLVHNMATEGLRARVYLGWGLPPVKNLPLQYIYYMTRDIATTGKPVTHPWHRRFYETQQDAQEMLFNWIEQTWQCIFDTVEWLTYRLQRTL